MSLILIADDNPHAHRMGRQILSQEGYDVATVSNGDEALQYLEEHRPALVMVDTRMPGPSGFEVCRRIKADSQLEGVKVVLLAGPLEPFDSSEAEAAGSDGVLHKPLDAYTLIDTVKSLAGEAEPAATPPEPGLVAEDVPPPQEAAPQTAEAWAPEERPEPVATAVLEEFDATATEAPVAAQESVAEELPEAPEPAVAAELDVASEPDEPVEDDPFGSLVLEALGADVQDARRETLVREAVREVLSASMPTLVDALTERVLARLREQD